MPTLNLLPRALCVSIAVLTYSSFALAFSCPGRRQVQSPAPPTVAIIAPDECCGPSAPEAGTLAEAIPVSDLTDDLRHSGACPSANDTESLENLEDTTRERVEVEVERSTGASVFRPRTPLANGAWVLRDSQDVYGTCVGFVVDETLSVEEPPVPALELVEVFSGSLISDSESDDFAFVEFAIDFDAPAVLVEVFEVAGDSRQESVATITSSYEELRLGEAPTDCEGVVDLDPMATYDVRVAPYRADGTVGEWSDFTRVEVPKMPTGACAFAPPQPGTWSGWSFAALAFAAWLVRRQRSSRRAFLHTP